MNDGGLPFERIAILGLGLMGGSLGLALKDAAGTSGRRASLADGDSVEVRGWNRTASRIGEAERSHVIDVGAHTAREAAAGADLVVVATPVSTIAHLAEEVASETAEGCVITDVGSVKGVIVSALEARIGDGRHFVGGHPMCGSELAGLESASSDLYEGANWVLTPTAKTDDKAFSRLSATIRSLGARVLAVDPEAHDRFVAVVSHVPHLTAASLLNVAAAEAASAEGLLHLAAGGFRDVTRIASGNAGLWSDICSVNREAIGRSLGSLIDELERMRVSILDGDLDSLSDRLEAASGVRSRLPIGAGVEGDLFEVVVPVPDRPGVLAEVSTLVGAIGVNIGDISISHTVEGGEGLLSLVISGEEEASKVVDELRRAGYSGAARPIEPETPAQGVGGEV